jgi:hypothetical protein
MSGRENGRINRRRILRLLVGAVVLFAVLFITASGFLQKGEAVRRRTKSNVKPMGMRANLWGGGARGGMCSISHFFFDTE